MFCALVRMSMVNVREMCVRVGNGQVHMGMRVWLITRIDKVVFVLVVFVMTMPMRMRQPLVRVLMFVRLAHVQPDTQRHQGRADPERQMRQFGPNDEREGHAEKRRDGKIRAGARRSKVT